MTDNETWSKSRLDRMYDVLAGHVERRGLLAVVTLVSRRGEMHVDALGTRVLGGRDAVSGRCRSCASVGSGGCTLRASPCWACSSRAAGQPLEQSLRERIFDPLGMKDSRFSVPAAKRDRLAGSYTLNAETGTLDVYDDAGTSQWRDPPAFPDAEGGLVSTVDDYVAFGQMMLNKGQHGNERILSRASVELMTTGQTTPEQRLGTGFFLENNRDWGFGASIITQRDDVVSAPGRFGWDGA